MAADSAEEVSSEVSADDDINESLDDNENDSSSMDSNNDQDADYLSDNQDDNGDRDDLIDYLDSDKSDLSPFSESTEWKTELNNDVDTVTNYLDSDKGIGEYREMFDREGNHISNLEAKQQIGKDQFRAVIYNPEKNLSISQLHELSDKIIDSKSEKLGKPIEAVYAVHQRADGTNGHLHIVYHAQTKAELSKAQVDHTKLSKQELKDWIVERAEIVNSVERISEKEISRNNERLKSLEGKNRENGSQRRDSTIERYMGKQDHNNGNFSLTQVSKSFDHSVAKGTMTQIQKDRLISEIKGRCETHVKTGIAIKVNENKYKFNRTAFKEHVKLQDIQKQQRVQNKVDNFLNEKYKNFNVEHTFNYKINSQTPIQNRDFKYKYYNHNSSHFYISTSSFHSPDKVISASGTVNMNANIVITEEEKKRKKLLSQLSL